jgi:hypothetical protein
MTSLLTAFVLGSAITLGALACGLVAAAPALTGLDDACARAFAHSLRTLWVPVCAWMALVVGLSYRLVSLPHWWRRWPCCGPGSAPTRNGSRSG